MKSKIENVQHSKTNNKKENYDKVIGRCLKVIAGEVITVING